MNNTANSAPSPYKPTPEMIATGENLFLAMAYERTVRPIVEGYERKILAERSWEVAPEQQAVPGEVEYVTDINMTWLMKGDAFNAYRKRCNEERIAAKLDSAIDDSCEQDDYCPLLVAQDVTRRARFALCDAMASVTNINGATAVGMMLADYDKLIDITLKLLAPFITNPLAPLEPA